MVAQQFSLASVCSLHELKQFVGFYLQWTSYDQNGEKVISCKGEPMGANMKIASDSFEAVVSTNSPN